MIATLWSALWSRFAGWIAAAGVALAILAAAYSRGKTDAAAKQTRQRLETINKARKVEDEVDRLGDADVRIGLDRWMRDGKR
ncbi:hypothetical protein G6N74_29520 [Mesorhizobium sp. CGMCC 1.15528]|uniref:Uncharacterized protein n=1 Tax=Mesorhizobium zhangyense TaxID=1776730 RepID=A0A7C9RC39_9HYPH|nr:hypothetical protein [Mesorhizobium zhangyense]NGN45196.1 hypothetical protein [Mesorhizobium zhangyense]